MVFALIAKIFLRFDSYYFLPLLIIALILILLYYKVTIPPVNKFLKSVLIFLRFVTVSLIILLLFNPTLIIKSKETKQSKILIAVDNSESMKNFSHEIKQTIRYLNRKLKLLGATTNFISFGNRVRKIKNIDSLKFNETATNFDVLLDTLIENSEYESSIIISDGNISEGESPLNKAEMLGSPLYSIGIGYANKIVDVSVTKVLHNSISFINKPTTIKAEILNNGLEGNKLQVFLKNGKRILKTKQIKLSNSGLNIVQFTYTPKTKGIKRLTIELSNIKGDVSPLNNSSSFFIKVLSSKISVLLITGSPNYDFEFVKQSLNSNKDFSVKSIIELTNLKPLRLKKIKYELESSNVIGLISFPSKNTSNTLLKLISNTLSKKSYFILLSNNISFKKLRRISNILNFLYSKNEPSIDQGEIVIQNMNNSIFEISGINIGNIFSTEPPVNVYLDIIPKINTLKLASIKLTSRRLTIPFIITSSQPGIRSVSIMGSEIWRWKLTPNLDSQYLFDGLWANIIKWLNASRYKKRINIYLVKKIFNRNEEISFSAEVFDEKLTKINNASIEVTAQNKNGKYSIILLNKGNGLYEGHLINLPPGEYSYIGKVKLFSKTIFTKRGKFFIRAINAESIRKNLNVNFLSLLAKLSGGSYFSNKTTNGLLQKIEADINKNKKTFIIKDKIILTFNFYYLFIIILFFSLELFLRKQVGLI